MTARKAAPAQEEATAGWWSPGVRLAVGLTLIAIAWTLLFAAERGLQVRYFESAGVPMRYVQIHPAVRAELHAELHADEEPSTAPDEHLAQDYPGVVVVHGYAGSSALMLSYSHVLTRAGYGVLLLDLPGHGANPAPMSADGIRRAITEAIDALARQPEIDPTRIALVGHSMGAGAVIEVAAAMPDRVAAVVAISPVGAAPPTMPRNLQLQAGTWEPRFLGNARRLLEAAGGPDEGFSTGEARGLVEIPMAEHVSILFRDASHAATRNWLDAAFGSADLPESNWRDRRILWWLLYGVGLVLLVSSLAPGVALPGTVTPRRGAGFPWIVLAVAPFVATAVCWLVGQVLDLGSLGSVAMAPALGLWFAIAGGLVLFVPFEVARIRPRQIGGGLLLFGFLWLAVGVTADLVWVSWGLETARWQLWPVVALASIPWFAGVEALRSGRRGRDRLVGWLLESAVVVAALWLLAMLVPGLGVIVLLLPLIPLFLGLLVVINGRINDPWVAGIGCGLFWGWLLVTAFPIVG